MNGVPRARELGQRPAGGRARRALDLGVAEPGTGRVRAHAAGVRARVAVADALVVRAAASGDASLAVASANTDSSSPSSSSSITSGPPSAARRAQRRRRAPRAVRQTKTPLPAARPSALTTQGGRGDRRASRAVGHAGGVASRPWRSVFEPSIRAAAALGPNTETPAWRSSSATPATSGASGPTTTRSIVERPRRARAALRASSARTGWQLRRARRCRGCPAPRAARRARGLCASFHASACSRPPDPTTSTFTRRVYCGRGATPTARHRPWS